MPLIFDTHVHIYQALTFEQAIESALSNAKKLMPQAGRHDCPLVLCLTERRGERLFEGLSYQSKQKVISANILCQDVLDNKVLKLIVNGQDHVFLLAGRQIICKEKFEILGLFLSKEIAAGLSAKEVIDILKQEEALIVLPWSFGKWWFKRGQVVCDLIKNASPDSLLIGDIPMRVLNVFDPKPIKLARKKGVRILYGTDPLPITGDRNVFASFCSYSELDLSSEGVLESLKSILTTGCQDRPLGRRNSFFHALGRWLRLQFA